MEGCTIFLNEAVLFPTEKFWRPFEASEALFLEGGCLDDASLDLAPQHFRAFLAMMDLVSGVSSHFGGPGPNPKATRKAAKRAAAEAADHRALLPHGQPQDDGAEQGPVWGFRASVGFLSFHMTSVHNTLCRCSD